eukprot:TRINITY_DN1902_c0_g1_i1.p1 TRINITY_DN1902_c0_g1~~TRINITY_DN1902_c0_g1_i1.p1  ORF type:complete len:307 (+),score=34.13 TRINITY_DN1902_c0_g1_i1:1275-2195(+)
MRLSTAAHAEESDTSVCSAGSERERFRPRPRDAIRQSITENSRSGTRKMLLEGYFGEWHDFVLITLGTFLVEQMAFLFFNAPYMYMDEYKVLQKYKIQRDRIVSSETRWANFWDLLRGHVIQIVMLVVFYPLLRFCGFTASGPYPSWSVFLTQFVIINLIEDTGFYWVHRWMHTEWAFKKFHYHHHKYLAPFSLVGEIAHPVEFLFNFLLPIMAGPLLLGYLQGIHITTFWVWLVFRAMRSTDSHSGYNLPFHPLRLIGFIYGGPIYHDYHHMVKGLSCNFGGYKIWDWIMGTASGAAFLSDSKQN